MIFALSLSFHSSFPEVDRPQHQDQGEYNQRHKSKTTGSLIRELPQGDRPGNQKDKGNYIDKKDKRNNFGHKKPEARGKRQEARSKRQRILNNAFSLLPASLLLASFLDCIKNIKPLQLLYQLAFRRYYGKFFKVTKNIIVFDLETQRSFDEVGGRGNLADLGVSLLGAYFYSTNEYCAYEERSLKDFEERLRERPLLVGFNTLKFDNVVLQPYLSLEISKLPQLDIMNELVKILGHRVSLDSVAKATLGSGKIASGIDALKYWAAGEIDKLKKYCLEDVKITKDIYEYGAKYGELFYTLKFGSGKGRAPVKWEIKHPEEGTGEDKQQSFNF